MANKYLRAGAAGSNNGNDWTNAYTSLSTLETNLARGDVGYVADGAYTSVTLNTATSGTSTITIKKATIADHGTSTGWSDTYGDGVATFTGTMKFTTQYWVFDGVSGGGPDSWNVGHGFEIDHSGTAGAGCEFSASNQSVRHVKLIGNNGSSDSNSDSFSWATPGGSNISVAYCYTTNAGRCTIFANQTAGSILFEYCYFNGINGFGSVHGEAASIWGTPTDWTIRYCLLTDIDSTGGFMWDNQNSPSGYFRVYGCVFYDIGSAWGTHGNGLLGGWTGGANEECHNFKVYNCTFITVSSGTACLGSNPDISSGLENKNNLFYNCSNVDATIWSSDYNHFINSEVVGSNTTTSVGDPFADFASFNFRLEANTAAGVDLGSPFSTDMYGRTRSTWTRGAIEFVEDSSGSITCTSFNCGALTVG